MISETTTKIVLNPQESCDLRAILREFVLLFDDDQQKEAVKHYCEPSDIRRAISLAKEMDESLDLVAHPTWGDA